MLVLADSEPLGRGPCPWKEALCVEKGLLLDKETFDPLTADPLRLYTLPYWSNSLFLVFDIRALWRSVDQYGAEPFEQQQFGTAGVKGVNRRNGCELFFFHLCTDGKTHSNMTLNYKMA